MSLQDKQIVLTRPRHQSAELEEELQRHGARVHLAPLIRTEPIHPESLAAAVARLVEFDWLVFTSANGVAYFHEQFAAVSAQMPAGIRIAAIGPATAGAVERYGWSVSLRPRSSNSEGLVEAFRRFPVKGKHFGLFIAEKTRDILPAALSQMEARVTVTAVYRTVPDEAGIVALQALPWDRIDAVVFASGSAAEIFAARRPRGAKRSGIRHCAVGAVTARRMPQLGLRVDLVAGEASVQGIVEVLEVGLEE
jgi:uroporphyrinogen III methyltransferase/synthase